MVARLEWAKKNPTEEFSTNAISCPQDAEISAFAVAPQQQCGSEIQDITLQGTAGEIQTVEAWRHVEYNHILFDNFYHKWFAIWYDEDSGCGNSEKYVDG